MEIAEHISTLPKEYKIKENEDEDKKIETKVSEKHIQGKNEKPVKSIIRKVYVHQHDYNVTNPKFSTNPLYSSSSVLFETKKGKPKITVTKVYLGKGDETYRQAVNLLQSFNFGLSSSTGYPDHFRQPKLYLIPASSFLQRKDKLVKNDGSIANMNNYKVATGDTVAVLMKEKLTYKILPMRVTHIKSNYGVLENVHHELNNTILSLLPFQRLNKFENGTTNICKNNNNSIERSSMSNVTHNTAFNTNAIPYGNHTVINSDNATVLGSYNMFSNSSISFSPKLLSKQLVLSSVRSSVCLTTVKNSIQKGSIVFSVIKSVSIPFTPCNSVDSQNQQCLSISNSTLYSKNNRTIVVNDISHLWVNANENENNYNITKTKMNEKISLFDNKENQNGEDVWLEMAVFSDANDTLEEKEAEERRKEDREDSKPINVEICQFVQLSSIFDEDFLKFMGEMLKKNVEKEMMIYKKRKKKFENFVVDPFKKKKQNQSIALRDKKEIRRKAYLESSSNSYKRFKPSLRKIDTIRKS